MAWEDVHRDSAKRKKAEFEKADFVVFRGALTKSLDQLPSALGEVQKLVLVGRGQ